VGEPDAERPARLRDRFHALKEVFAQDVAFLRFRALFRQPAGLRFLFLVFSEGVLS
jgi:hypothetical protein